MPNERPSPVISDQGPFDVAQRPLHLNDTGTIVAFHNDSDFWASIPSRDELRSGRLVSVFAYKDTWNRWERHPRGDELVMVISGSVDFVLDDDTRQWTISMGGGSGCLVPRNVWHRAVVHEPSTLLFITPTPALTEERAF